MRKPSKGVFFQREGIGASPQSNALQATSGVARDDRDGSSRYRASKMPLVGELGWYRDHTRPYV